MAIGQGAEYRLRPMEFRILGPLEVWDGRQALSLGGAKLRALLAILLINANQVVAQSRLIELLWGGHPPTTAPNSLQVHIAHLRRLLEPRRKANEPWQVLVWGSNGYELRVQPEQLDAIQFERMADDAVRAKTEQQWDLAADQFRAALGLWRGPVLAEFASEPFAFGEIARLQELRLTALEDRIDVDLSVGRHAEILPEIKALVFEYPLRERLCGQLMLALYRQGLQAEASSVYHNTRSRLMDELGMRPGPVLDQVFRDILKHAGNLDTAWSQSQGNLPHPLTTFIGRRDDLDHLIRRIVNIRLLTLTGSGGIGKTRLAIELARQISRSFPDGLWLIDLAPISDPTRIAQAVARELKVQEQAGRSIAEMIEAYFRNRQALLVLDNCERVIAGSAEFALAMLSKCSRLKLLATSRERLGIAGEQVWQLGSLTVPDPLATSTVLPKFEAVQLFLDRACLVRPTFELSDSNASAVVQICRRLDGIPLAIELAAARMSELTASEIADRLDDRLSLLATAERGRPVRHETLRAALDWSYHLLDRSEQALFARLGVFTGAFDLKAVQAVCVSSKDDWDPAQLIARLVEKSLVVGDAADRNSIRMLETIREFARSSARMKRESRWLGRRHAEHFLSLVQSHGVKLRSSAATQHLAVLDRNADNVRSALEWASANDHQFLSRLVLGLHAYWTSRFSLREALMWVTLALADCEPSLRRQLLLNAGWLELACAQVDLGLEHSEQALAAAVVSQDERAEVRALINLGEAYGSLADMEKAMDCLHRAVAVAESIQEQQASLGNVRDTALVAGSRCMIGAFHVITGEIELAASDLIRGTELARQAGDIFLEAMGLCWQSQVALAKANLSGAEDLARRGLEFGIALDHRFVMLRAVGQLAAIAAAKGCSHRALQLAAAVHSVRGAGGVRGFDQVDFWLGPGGSGRLQHVRELVGPVEASRIWEGGSRLSVYEATAIALSEPAIEPLLAK